MGNSVEKVNDNQPRTERTNRDNSDTPKADDCCLRPQSLDRSSEDKEPLCMTPTTASTENVDERSNASVAALSLREVDEQATDAVSIADEQTCSQPKGDDVSSDTDGCNSNDADQVDRKPQFIYGLIKDDEDGPEFEDAGGFEAEDGNCKDPAANEDNDNDNSAPGEEADKHTSQQERNGNRGEGEEKVESKDSKGPEDDAARIELPKPPYFNPFNAAETDDDTSHRLGSIDGILSLDDTPAYVEPSIESPAKREWTRRKEQLGEQNEALDKVMEMVGIEAVKAAFLEVKDMIEASRGRQGRLKRQALDTVLMGNPGTGKRTLAELYYDLLYSCGVWDQKSTNLCFVERSGHYLRGRSEIINLEHTIAHGVQMLYIRDMEHVNSSECAVLMDVLNDLSEDIVIVLSGSFEQMPVVLGSSPAARWLFPRRLHIEDFNDDELRRLFVQIVKQDSFRVEKGPQAPFARIVAQRVGRARDEAGFGNVHELRLSYGKILERHSTRMRQRLLDIEDSWAKPMPDENLLTGEDLIGPEPEDIRAKSEAWKKLEKMAGLEDVKAAVDQLLNRSKVNYHRELAGTKLLETSLNRVFLGPPGRGKTTVAKLYGQILADIGLVSSRTVVYKTPGDFIGQVFGESEDKTRAILDSAKGKVLIIDDAHMFYHGTELGAKESDEFRLACIDVLVSKVHNRPGDDRCVILIGYLDRMEEMLQRCNPGMRRRFPLEEAFRFHDYDDARLKEILELKMVEDGVKTTPAAMEVAAEVLRRARDRPNFGNGGDVVNFVNQAKARHRARVSGMMDAVAMEVVLEPEDFDPAHDRGATAAERCRAHFNGLVGFEDTIQRFEGYQRIAENLRLNGKDPRGVIPFNYVFKGPPGTGKTHTARVIGRIFYDMGFLSTDDVIECSATHLIGKHVGHTGPKVVELFERSLGKVLFIDEAYRLADDDRVSYAHEAIGEIVDCMTKPRYYRKMVIVLAGYTHDMDQLLRVNAGLRGRFATEINFSPMSPESALRHLCQLLAKQDIELLDDGDGLDGGREAMKGLFAELAETTGWSNGRDMQTLAGVVTEYVYGNLDGSGGALGISTMELVRLVGDMLEQRTRGGEE